jgi:hypothetical protein
MGIQPKEEELIEIPFYIVSIEHAVSRRLMSVLQLLLY